VKLMRIRKNDGLLDECLQRLEVHFTLSSAAR
jgi:hypothetical protein